MTAAMLERTRAGAAEIGLANVEAHESLIELLPLADASVDVVISDGVIDLVPDNDAVFDEIDRVLRPGGRLQFADVVIHQPRYDVDYVQVFHLGCPSCYASDDGILIAESARRGSRPTARSGRSAGKIAVSSAQRSRDA